jgi:ATP-dependent exoDNAse (exonuclease V) beta subunit
LPNDDARKTYAELLDRLIGSRCELSREVWRDKFVPSVLAICEAVAAQEIREPWATEFLEWMQSEPAEAAGTPSKIANLFRYPTADPKVSVKLGSIHSVKGETHTATLVLDSFHMTHHLKKLIPWLAGKRPKAGEDNTGEEAALIERLKLHYVAMTRPSHLLCLAMRSDALKPKDRVAIQARNWRIIDCVSPATK